MGLCFIYRGSFPKITEDTLKFARIMEGLGAELFKSLMTLIAFTPFYGVYQEYNRTS